MLAPMVAAAQNADNADGIEKFLPGLLLDETARKTLDRDALDARIFPSEKYSTQSYEEDELYRLYDAKEYNKVVFGLLRLARQGDARAEQTIGIMYRFGQGLAPDDEQAHRWFLRASEGQMPLAQHHLGSMYYNGQGVTRDLLKSAMYMTLAVQNYTPGSERDQAIEDLKNIKLRLSRIEQEQTDEMVREYLARYPKAEPAPATPVQKQP